MHAFDLPFRSFFLLLYTFLSNVCTFNYNEIVALHMKCYYLNKEFYHICSLSLLFNLQ